MIAPGTFEPALFTPAMFEPALFGTVVLEPEVLTAVVAGAAGPVAGFGGEVFAAPLFAVGAPVGDAAGGVGFAASLGAGSLIGRKWISKRLSTTSHT